MKKSILLTLALLACASFSVVHAAEQAKANEYRKILNSDCFYLDYEEQSFTSTGSEKNTIRSRLAAKAGLRSCSIEFSKPGFYPMYNGLAHKDYPDILYKDGKYYQFVERKKAIMAYKEQLQDPAIDTRGGWNKVHYMLGIPQEFGALCINDAFRATSKVINAPQYLGSLKRKLKNKEYDCDSYSLLVRNQSGSGLAEEMYYYYYDKGILTTIESYLKMNGKELLLKRIKVLKLNNLPESKYISFAPGSKVYAVGVGNMDDLLEKLVEVESY